MTQQRSNPVRTHIVIAAGFLGMFAQNYVVEPGGRGHPLIAALIYSMRAIGCILFLIGLYRLGKERAQR